MVKPATMLLAAMLCSMPAFDPALAETPAAACLTANGQRLYHIRPFRNTPLPPGCRTGDTLIRFQLEQPGTTVRKLRNTLTAPGERLFARLGDFEIRQVFEASPGFSRCEIAVEVSQDAFRLGGVAGADPNDIAVDGATFFIDQNRVHVQEIADSISGGPPSETQLFLADGSALFIDDVVTITNFGPVPDGCFAAATVRFASDARSLYAP
jgi:hypothetical protein